MVDAAGGTYNQVLCSEQKTSATDNVLAAAKRYAQLSADMANLGYVQPAFDMTGAPGGRPGFARGERLGEWAALMQMPSARAARLAGKDAEFAEWIAHAARRRVPTGLVQATWQAYTDGNATLRPFANLIGIDTATLREALGDSIER